ncbi:MAG: hypothetical protein M1816_001939 [Peltula sp. TS41687]|nr:MAG: hypothetical protein M1816_001939 [Peltula sp. TS41687]
MQHHQWSFIALLFPLLLFWTVTTVVCLHPATAESVAVVKDDDDREKPRPISAELFAELEELSRIVDIAYCVGTTGIMKPFLCASRCQDFDHFELITTWSTGLLLSDSCGYLAVDHSPRTPRIIVAFRGTYSLANMIIDLSTMPQRYIPYPPDDGDDGDDGERGGKSRCEDCAVHAGFLFSWQETRKIIIPHLKRLKQAYPTHQLALVGHSLGGAIAALAALEFHHRGWDPQVTTFGEPRVGNEAMAAYFDARFGNNTTVGGSGGGTSARFRRVTHVDDQVPLLPLQEWGYRMHAGEIFIAKPALPPAVTDVFHCVGDADPRCIASDRIFGAGVGAAGVDDDDDDDEEEEEARSEEVGRFEAQFIMAHRDYFWRLGLCIPGGDPTGRWQAFARQKVDVDLMPEEL